MIFNKYKVNVYSLHEGDEKQKKMVFILFHFRTGSLNLKFLCLKYKQCFFYINYESVSNNRRLSDKCSLSECLQYNEYMNCMNNFVQ